MIDKIMSRYEGEVFLKADGFDDAIIGIDEHSMRLIYSGSKCIEILIKNGQTREEAMEYFYKTERKTHPSFLRGLDVSDHLTLIEDILTNSIR